MTFPSTGMTPSELISRLEQLRAKDADWRSGRTWSLVYSAGGLHEDVLRDAYLRYFNENGLSPTAFPSLARMEREVVWSLLDLLQGDPSTGGGTMASGGTESIILATKAYRDASDLERPSVVIPSTAHPAFLKACQLLRIEPIIVPVTADLVADVVATRDAVRPDTVMLAASAPAFPYGLVDPIPALAEVAAERGIGLHVDACLGGFVLPFIRQLGYGVPAFDFTVDGVTSISADLHKYGYGPKGSSAVLYRNRNTWRSQFAVVSGWPGGALASPTLLGTRPGGAIAAAWAAIHHLGIEGYLELFESLMELTNRLQTGIREIGDLRIIGEPPMTVFAVASESKDVFAVADLLERKQWRIDRQANPDSMHFIVNPTHVPVIDEFLTDLADAYSRAPARGTTRRRTVYGISSVVEAEGDIDRALLDGLESLYTPSRKSPPET